MKFVPNNDDDIDVDVGDSVGIDSGDSGDNLRLEIFSLS